MKPRILLWAGLGLLIIGTTLHWTAANLARNYIQRDSKGTAWTTDAIKKERIGFTSFPEDLRKWAGTFSVLLPHGRDE